jgi:hypothetical protein
MVKTRCWHQSGCERPTLRIEPDDGLCVGRTADLRADPANRCEREIQYLPQTLDLCRGRLRGGKEKFVLVPTRGRLPAGL